MSFVPLPLLPLPIPPSGPSPTPTTASFPPPLSSSRRMIAPLLKNGCVVDWAQCRARFSCKPLRDNTKGLSTASRIVFQHYFFRLPAHRLILFPFVSGDYSITLPSLDFQVDIEGYTHMDTTQHSLISIHNHFTSNTLNVVASPTIGL